MGCKSQSIEEKKISTLTENLFFRLRIEGLCNYLGGRKAAEEATVPKWANIHNTNMDSGEINHWGSSLWIEILQKFDSKTTKLQLSAECRSIALSAQGLGKWMHFEGISHGSV